MFTSTSSRPKPSTAAATSDAAPSHEATSSPFGRRPPAGGLDLGDDRLGQLDVDVVDDDRGALGGQRERLASPDAAPGAGDDGDLAVERTHGGDRT